MDVLEAVGRENGPVGLSELSRKVGLHKSTVHRLAQEVLLGLFKSLVSINGLMRVPELYEIYRQNVETNLSLADVLPLASMAPGLVANPEKIRQYAVGPAEVYSYTTEAGAQVLMPNYNAVYYLVQQAVYGE